MKIAYMLRDPLDLWFLFVYVIGVLVLIFAAMQLLHTVLYKDTKARRDGVRALLLGIGLLTPRIIYHQLYLDASDYKKAVTAAYQSTTDATPETADGYTLLAIQHGGTDPANADIVVLEGGKNMVAIDLLLYRVQGHIDQIHLPSLVGCTK